MSVRVNTLRGMVDQLESLPFEKNPLVEEMSVIIEECIDTIVETSKLILRAAKVLTTVVLKIISTFKPLFSNLW